MTLYELINIKKYYGDILALNIPSLTLEEGKFYVIYGPNAAGKTTLLNLLAFLDSPTEGEINFSSINREVTLVMQNPYLFKTTVFENVARGLIFHSVSKNEIEQRIEPVMKQLGIWELRDRHSATLSEGQKKRVAIARAIVLDTKVLLMDEPTSNLDKPYFNLAEDLISFMGRNIKKTTIITTHDLNQACRCTNNIIYLIDGKITESPLWNMFLVNLADSGGVKKTELTPGIEIYVATEKSGKTTIAINPRDIIISREKINSSALNNLKARIISINQLNGILDLVVDIKVPLHVFITNKSFTDMHLNIGEEIFVAFKASAVEVF